MKKNIRQIAMVTGLMAVLGLTSGCGNGDKRTEAYYNEINKICGAVETYGESVQCYNDASAIYSKALSEAVGDFNIEIAYKIARNRTLIQLSKKYNIEINIEPEESKPEESKPETTDTQ